MATILREYETCDGYNVVCLFEPGGKLTLHFLSTPTEEDKNSRISSIQNMFTEEAAEVTLESEKNRLIAELDAWYNTISNNGVIIGEIELAATINDQNRFDALITAEHLAFTLGLRQLTDITGLSDKNGVWHEMTLGDLFSLLLQFGNVCAEWSHQYAVKLTSINNATTIEELEEISI